MGKIEDMRRLREQQFAANDDKRAAIAKTPAEKSPAQKTPAEKTPAEKTPAQKPRAATAAADEGKCSVCGKMKPLTNGLVANHQKGFGKACAGSRKEPA